MVLGALPFGVFLIMYLQNPRYYISAAGHPWFIFCMGGAAVLYIISMYVIRKIIQIRV